MCGGVYFEYNGEVIRQYFPNPKAVLPTKKKDGSLVLLPWGRRQSQGGMLPMGGWAKLESIYSGQWDKFFPKPVKIPVLSFMENDLEGHPHWYDLNKGQYIQGMLARDNNEHRLYIVIIEPDLQDGNIHSRWPRVVQSGENRSL